MPIYLNQLDKTKTYACCQIGNDLIAKSIQTLSKKETDLPTNQISSHVFALVYKDNDWYVFQSHLDNKGCVKLLYSDWQKQKDNYKCENSCFARELNVDVLEFWANPLFNMGYGVFDIAELAIEELTKINFHHDISGMICSEYLALADKGFKICYDYKLKPCKVKPIHWQLELMKEGSK